MLSSKNFARGEKPAIDYGLSVSRLGGNVQTKDMKKVGSKLRRELLSYLEVRSVYELANIDEMSKELQKKMKDGKVILNKLKQYKFSPKSKEEMKNDFAFLFEENTTEAPKEENNKENNNIENPPQDTPTQQQEQPTVITNDAVTNEVKEETPKEGGE